MGKGLLWFGRGGNIAKHYAYQKKSVIQIGKFMFVHGGISHSLASKYTIHELNTIVRKWLLKDGTEEDDKVFDEIFLICGSFLSFVQIVSIFFTPASSALFKISGKLS